MSVIDDLHRDAVDALAYTVAGLRPAPKIVSFETRDPQRAFTFRTAALANVHATFWFPLKDEQVALSRGFVESVRQVIAGRGATAWVITIREEELPCPTTSAT